ncbi:MAG: phosphoglucomutase/phosphomannomutase family protein [Acidobacteria bacterium]|nr:phosphoglucomutase/phosphomannomutase family protein [Acidobacteriota bacterium]
MTPIKFGTSGWRAIIAEDFTFSNVQRAVDGIAEYVLSVKSKQPTILVGYDTRFLSDQFAAATAERMAAHGIRALLSDKPVPTPALAFAILQSQADGGINFTASHNPAEYNGIKFSTANGAPALPEVTRKIEENIAHADRAPVAPRSQASPAAVERVDFAAAYLTDLARKVDIDAIRLTRLKLVVDPLYGAGQGYLDKLLVRSGIDVQTIHGTRDVLFGGHPPEPAEEYLTPLKKAIRERGANLGLATDGDADRYGIMDYGGVFISPNHFLALLLDYLAESRPWVKETSKDGWKGGVARSVATTHLVDSVARHHGLPVHETPVGFKYIGELIEQDKLLVGGEESAGLTIRHHVPEKDGILACLLAAEMVATRRRTLSEQLDALFLKVGRWCPGRWNVPLTETLKTSFKERSMRDYSSFDGHTVHEQNRTDGLKLIFDDGSWILFRLSGTEPVCRLYCEARSEKALEELATTARNFLFA